MIEGNIFCTKKHEVKSTSVKTCILESILIGMMELQGACLCSLKGPCAFNHSLGRGEGGGVYVP
jgi:hypothetical protein